MNYKIIISLLILFSPAIITGGEVVFNHPNQNAFYAKYKECADQFLETLINQDKVIEVNGNYFGAGEGIFWGNCADKLIELIGGEQIVHDYYPTNFDSLDKNSFIPLNCVAYIIIADFKFLHEEVIGETCDLKSNVIMNDENNSFRIEIGFPIRSLKSPRLPWSKNRDKDVFLFLEASSCPAIKFTSEEIKIERFNRMLDASAGEIKGKLEVLCYPNPVKFQVRFQKNITGEIIGKAKFVTSYTELGIELPNPDWLKDWIGTKDYIEIHASFNSSSFVGAERLLK